MRLSTIESVPAEVATDVHNQSLPIATACVCRVVPGKREGGLEDPLMGHAVRVFVERVVRKDEAWFGARGDCE